MKKKLTVLSASLLIITSSNTVKVLEGDVIESKDKVLQSHDDNKIVESNYEKYEAHLALNYELFMAVLEDNPKKVHDLIADGADVDARWLNKRWEDNLLGSNDNKFMYQATPIVLAAFLERTVIIQALLSLGANPELHGGSGWSAIYVTCLYRQNTDIGKLFYWFKPDYYTFKYEGTAIFNLLKMSKDQLYSEEEKCGLSLLGEKRNKALSSKKEIKFYGLN